MADLLLQVPGTIGSGSALVPSAAAAPAVGDQQLVVAQQAQVLAQLPGNAGEAQTDTEQQQQQQQQQQGGNALKRRSATWREGAGTVMAKMHAPCARMSGALHTSGSGTGSGSSGNRHGPPVTAAHGNPFGSSGGLQASPPQRPDHAAFDELMLTERSSPFGVTPSSLYYGASAANLPNSALTGEQAAAQRQEEQRKEARMKQNRADGGVARKLTLEQVTEHFGKSMKDATDALGVCPTTLKRACRRLGIPRWPRTEAEIPAVMAGLHTAGADGAAAGAAVGSSGDLAAQNALAGQALGSGGENAPASAAMDEGQNVDDAAVAADVAQNIRVADGAAATQPNTVSGAPVDTEVQATAALAVGAVRHSPDIDVSDRNANAPQQANSGLGQSLLHADDAPQQASRLQGPLLHTDDAPHFLSVESAPEQPHARNTSIDEC